MSITTFESRPVEQDSGVFGIGGSKYAGSRRQMCELGREPTIRGFTHFSRNLVRRCNQELKDSAGIRGWFIR